MRGLTAALVAINGLASLPAQSSVTAPGSIPRWTLSASPTIRLGDGSSPAEEFQRIAGAVRMPGGEIVVADGSTQELRIFSSQGRYLRTFSRRGEGPGEFRAIGPIFTTGDSLFVVESPPGPSQLHLFTLSDGFRNRVPIRPTRATGGLTATGRLTN